MIDPGAEGVPPIHRAARDGDLETLDRLLGADPGLIDAPVSPTGDATPLPTHPVTGALVPALLFDRRGRDRPLHTASRYARPEAVDLLLRRGASPDSRGELGRTAVHYAAYNAGGPLMELLAGRGADLDATDELGWTPLDAARKGEGGLSQEAVGRLLVDRGATPDLAAALWLSLPDRARAILAGGAGPVREGSFPEDLLPLTLLMLKDHARKAGIRVGGAAEGPRTSRVRLRPTWTSSTGSSPTAPAGRRLCDAVVGRQKRDPGGHRAPPGLRH